MERSPSLSQFLLTSITRVEVFVCAWQCAHGPGHAGSCACQILPGVGRMRCWAQQGSWGMTQRRVWQTLVAQGDFWVLRKFWFCCFWKQKQLKKSCSEGIRVAQSLFEVSQGLGQCRNLGLNLSQNFLWIQVHIPSGGCLQLGRKNLSCGERVVSHPPSLQCFPWESLISVFRLGYFVQSIPHKKFFVDLDFSISKKMFKLRELLQYQMCWTAEDSNILEVMCHSIYPRGWINGQMWISWNLRNLQSTFFKNQTVWPIYSRAELPGPPCPSFCSAVQQKCTQ